MSARYSVHLAPSGFAVMDGQSAGVVIVYSQRFRAEQHADLLNRREARGASDPLAVLNRIVSAGEPIEASES